MPLFRVHRHRPLPKTLRRLFAMLVQRADKELAAAPLTPIAVHEARKSVKRLRALVSLVASGLGDERRAFDHALRDINRALSATRDATVALATLDGLSLQAGDGLANDFAACRAALDRRLAHVTERELDVQQDVLAPLHRLQQAWKKWAWTADEWELLEPNIRRTYRRGRRMYDTISAGAPAERLHDLRKLVKQTQYHLEFLLPIAPLRMQSEHDEWERLADALGHHHDLWVLQGLLETAPAKELPRAARGLILGEIRDAARRLEHQVAQQAPIVYAERPRAFTARLDVYWQKWRMPDES